MQTLRLLPAVAAIALCASTFTTRADDTPAQAAARAALMQDMNETGNVETPTPPPSTPAPPAETPPPAPVPPPAPAQLPPPVATPAPVTTAPAQGNSSNLVLPPVEQPTVPTNQVTPYPVNPAPMNPAANSMTELTNAPSSTTPGMPPTAPDQPVTAPPVPLSEGQQQQLQALLQQYVANQITPAQYQAARAKIIGGQ
ncbi:MAG TPA: hypothetical protein VNU95_04615 [Candidatus Acidoferrales bacterium]|jgi:hypothetical protein|nr:hypothetical protein [Candidatus Acidoferrales bacterium]